jgi:hypothetical protein
MVVDLPRRSTVMSRMVEGWYSSSRGFWNLHEQKCRILMFGIILYAIDGEELCHHKQLAC